MSKISSVCLTSFCDCCNRLLIDKFQTESLNWCRADGMMPCVLPVLIFLSLTQCVVCLPGNRQELAGVLKYHLGEGMLVSGGVGSHTRIKPLQGDKLELGVVGSSSVQ